MRTARSPTVMTVATVVLAMAADGEAADGASKGRADAGVGCPANYAILPDDAYWPGPRSVWTATRWATPCGVQNSGTGARPWQVVRPSAGPIGVCRRGRFRRHGRRTRSQPYRSTSALPIEARWSRTPGGPVTSSHSISPESSPASVYSS